MVLSRFSSIPDEGKCSCLGDCEGTDSSALCDPLGNAYSGCAYDYRGRRTMKKVTVNGFVTQHQYFVHRGYQVIAAIDAATGNPDWQLVCDPAYATAARPLAFCRGDQVYTYGFDQTKNVCELFAESGQIATSYDYAHLRSPLPADGETLRNIY